MMFNHREFVDTTILVYAYDKTAGDKNVKSKKIVESLWQSSSGCLSIQVLQELYVVLTNKIESITEIVIREIIEDLGKWEIHSPKVDHILMAIDIQRENKLSFWDSMILCSAQILKCSVLWTEDLKHGQKYGEVLVKNPFVE